MYLGVQRAEKTSKYPWEKRSIFSLSSWKISYIRTLDLEVNNKQSRIAQRSPAWNGTEEDLKQKWNSIGGKKEMKRFTAAQFPLVVRRGLIYLLYLEIHG